MRHRACSSSFKPCRRRRRRGSTHRRRSDQCDPAARRRQRDGAVQRDEPLHNSPRASPTPRRTYRDPPCAPCARSSQFDGPARPRVEQEQRRAANRIKTIFASVPRNTTVSTQQTPHTTPLAPPCATVACVTWNLAATSPSSKDARFLENGGTTSCASASRSSKDLKPRASPATGPRPGPRYSPRSSRENTYCGRGPVSGSCRLTILQKKKSKLESEACTCRGLRIGNVLRNKGVRPRFWI